MKTVCFCLLLLLPMVWMFLARTAYAAGVTGYLTTSSSSYDLNGDGKKDTIRVQQPAKSNGLSAQLYINGKKAYAFPAGKYDTMCGYRVITLKNKKCFLLFSAEGPNPGVSDDVLLQYTSKRSTKKLFSFASSMAKYGTRGLITQNPSKKGVRVSGNSVIIKYDKMLWTTGGILLNFKFTYKGGTLKRASYKGSTDSPRTYTTAMKIQTYKKVNTNIKSVCFNPNTKVYIKNYYLKSSGMWLYLRDETGRGGWIKCLTQNPGGWRSPYFSDSFFAG